MYYIVYPFFYLQRAAATAPLTNDLLHAHRIGVARLVAPPTRTPLL
eukprot:COSAG01_NODE_3554_length_5940_cov_77.779319_11_plen_46_part_00